MLAWATGRNAAWLLAHGDDQLDAAASDAYSAACAKRSAGVPVAYVVGSAGFLGRDFVVDPSVLIPRPETELLVEDAIGHLRALEGREETPRALDVGTGSGAIACTVAAEVPSASVVGIDVSGAALALARKNAVRLGVEARCTFVLADVADTSSVRRYDAVVANLPYVPTADLPALPEGAAHEPRVALDGGSDGLDEIRKLLLAAPRLVRPGGLLLIEAAPPTMPRLLALTAAAFPGAELSVEADYAGLPRYVRLRNPLSDAPNEGSGIGRPE